MTADVHLMVLDPGHFHAALVQKEMPAGVDPTVHVYAPPGPDLDAHLARIASFNARAESPTHWDTVVRAGDDPLGRMLRERPGNVVVISGRNRGKIDRILACVEAGLHVLADKPWILEPEECPKLDRALRLARERGVVAYDVMTERYEIATIIQRELIRDPEVFGTLRPGDRDNPAVYIESKHFLKKRVAGVPLRRPASFLDVHATGEGLNDVGTHLVDLVLWTVPFAPPPRRDDVALHTGMRWPTVITPASFAEITGEAAFPASLLAATAGGNLEYFGNTSVDVTVGGHFCRITAEWQDEFWPGYARDVHAAIYDGSRSRAMVLDTGETGSRPYVCITPHRSEGAAVREAFHRRVQALGRTYPGLGALEDEFGNLSVRIPEPHHVGHEAHFTQVFRQFLDYVRDPQSFPSWEDAVMRVKYHLTTEGVALARKGLTDPADFLNPPPGAGRP